MFDDRGFTSEGYIVGLGFDGTATFSGQWASVQACLKKHTSHALYTAIVPCCR